MPAAGTGCSMRRGLTLEHDATTPTLRISTAAPMSHSLVLLTGSSGLAVVTLNILVERIGLPIPSLPMLVVAGAVSAGNPRWGSACLLSQRSLQC